MSKFNRRSRRLLAIMGLALMAILLAVPTALAFDGRGGDKIVIEAGEVIDDDLYVGASEFTLDGTVKGDLIVGGTIIRINGTVEGDLWAAGQTIIINGVVEDDVRAAGFALTVGGHVTDDFLAAGFSLENHRESRVGGDLLYAGYQALLAGDVMGNANLAGNAMKIDGTVGNHAYVDAGGAEPGQQMPPGFPFAPNMPAVPSIPSGLTIGQNASIGGDLNYTANDKADVPAGAVAGDTKFTRYVPEVKPEREITVTAPSPLAIVGRWFVNQVRRLITLLLIGALMMWLVPDWTRKVAGIVRSRPLPSLGWGVVVIAGFLVAMVALLIITILLAVILGVVTLGELAGRFAVLGGIVMSTTGFGFSVTWDYVTKAVVSLLLGQLTFRLFKSAASEHRWWPMLLGVLIFVIITAIPLLGWLARLATVLFGLGAIWLWLQHWLVNRRVAPAVVEAEA